MLLICIFCLDVLFLFIPPTNRILRTCKYLLAVVSGSIVAGQLIETIRDTQSRITDSTGHLLEESHILLDSAVGVSNALPLAAVTIFVLFLVLSFVLTHEFPNSKYQLRIILIGNLALHLILAVGVIWVVHNPYADFNALLVPNFLISFALNLVPALLVSCKSNKL